MNEGTKGTNPSPIVGRPRRAVRAGHQVALTLAISDYDHVRDLVSGRVQAEGIDLRCLSLSVEEIFFRFTRYAEWDVSELSLGKYCALRARGDDRLTAIPVFPSRAFRHSSIYVRADGPVDDPAALRGGRIGIPEWTVTATIYGRGLLKDEYGIGYDEVEWHQGGVNEVGRIETLEVGVPPGVHVQSVAERSLNEMLVAGDLEAIIAPAPPRGAIDGSNTILRLFSDCQTVEREYYARTRIFPVMHLIAIKREAYEVNRWIAYNLLSAFEEAKRRSLARVTDITASRFPLPWGALAAEASLHELGKDPWPYTVIDNELVLDAFLSWAHEQAVCERRLTPSDLFAPEVQTDFKV